MVDDIKTDQSIGWNVIAPDGMFMNEYFEPTRERAIEAFMRHHEDKQWGKHFAKKGWICAETFRRRVN